MPTILEDYLFSEIERNLEQSHTFISKIKVGCNGKVDQGRINSLMSIDKKISEVNLMLMKLYQWTRLLK